MKHKNRLNQALVLIVSISASSYLWADPVATTNMSAERIDWQPLINSTVMLEVTNGFQFSHRQLFKDSNPSFSVTQDGKPLSDGIYTYQLTGSDSETDKIRQSGGFKVLGGSILMSNKSTDEK